MYVYICTEGKMHEYKHCSAMNVLKPVMFLQVCILMFIHDKTCTIASMATWKYYKPSLLNYYHCKSSLLNSYEGCASESQVHLYITLPGPEEANL